ncbi:MAG: lipid asymmetry maintenance protein MlaB [Desulfococcaceae bacterium]
MAFIKEDRGGQSFLRLEGPLTVYEVGEMREVLLAALEGERDLLLDIAGICDCDTTGVQLLLSARKKARNEKKNFMIKGDSDAVRKAAERIGVSMESIFNQ